MSNNITIKIDHSTPMELGDVVNSLGALANIYKDHEANGDYKLSILEVRNGSAIFEIGSYMAASLPIVVDQVNNLVPFVQHLEYLKDKFLKGDLSNTNKKECLAIHELVAPCTAHPENRMSFKNNTFVDCTFNFEQSHTIQNRANERIRQIEETTGEFYENVILEWDKASKSPKSGNFAFISAIHERKVKTVFESESIHEKMVMEVDKPFNNIWAVNVHVKWHQDKPVKYTITEIVEDLGEA